MRAFFFFPVYLKRTSLARVQEWGQTLNHCRDYLWSSVWCSAVFCKSLLRQSKGIQYALPLIETRHKLTASPADLAIERESDFPPVGIFLQKSNLRAELTALCGSQASAFRAPQLKLPLWIPSLLFLIHLCLPPPLGQELFFFFFFSVKRHPFYSTAFLLVFYTLHPSSNCRTRHIHIWNIPDEFY